MRKRTIGEMLDALKVHLEVDGKFSPQTASHMKRAKVDFGHFRGGALTPEWVEAYCEERKENGDRPATVNRTTQLVQQAYNLAVENRRFAAARVPRIKKLDESDNAREDCLTEAQLASVIEHLPEHLQDFTRWCAACGMRKGEAGQLRWNMVHGDTLHIPANLCKNRTGRKLPIVGELAEILARRKATRSFKENDTERMSEFIFHRLGLPVYEFGVRDFADDWHAATKAAECPGHYFHGLRRFAVSTFLEAGLTSEVAMMLSGHKTQNMLTRYQMRKQRTRAKAQALKAVKVYRDQEQAKAKTISRHEVKSLRGSGPEFFSGPFFCGSVFGAQFGTVAQFQCNRRTR